MATPTTIAIVGFGKIARDQHVPALAANPAFALVATASPHSALAGVPAFRNIEQLLAQHPELSAVAICTTPQVRYAAARSALEHGCHVLLEKPPAATLTEVQALTELASARGVSLLASWHSRFANGVEQARSWLAGRTSTEVAVSWKEDVRVWHPGQAWIWRAGGLGVFDPGINALSILTRIIPGPIVLREATLSYPANCQTPIAARLLLNDQRGAPIRVEFDFLQAGPPGWNIDVAAGHERLQLSEGGAVLRINGELVDTQQGTEYSRLYAHFATLIQARGSDVDVSPLALVADALLVGERIEVEPFVE